MQLSEHQKKHLRGLGHQLKPVVMIGQAGVSEAVLAELEAALVHHELIKISVRVGDRETRDVELENLLVKIRATLVQRIGNTAVLYRRNPEKQRIQLPA